ncbi:MAG: hypothetical protein Q7J80_14750, partial [Anaerolineales bacterium]|nr:hypothetical protein [Anaerolineales bacterium]
NPFTSAIVRNVIESRSLEKNISILVDVLGKRVNAMDDSLRRNIPQAQFTTPHGGYFFWLRLPNVDTQELEKKAQTFLIGLRPGIRFSSQNGLREYMRLSVSFYGTDEIEQGIQRLKQCLENH